MNVSMVGNTRVCIQYGCETIDYLYDWMKEGHGETLQEFPNCGRNWGTWVNLPDLFGFLYYGGKYQHNSYIGTSSKVWVCTNGFISLDLSESTNLPPQIFPSSDSPNAVIAPLWADLIIDAQSRIITMRSTVSVNTYFVVIWKNALYGPDMSTRLTFAVAVKT
jgi:hypothetical protein